MVEAVVCHGCRYTMMPWERQDELCKSCKDIERQRREYRESRRRWWHAWLPA